MRTFIVAGLVMVATAWDAAPARAQHLVAYLDSQRILAEAPGATEARAAIQREMQTYQNQLQALDDSLNTLVRQFNARSLTMSPDAKLDEQRRMTAIQTELSATAQRLRVEAEQKQQEMMKPIIEKVDAAIEAIRKEGGYAIIFDASRGIMAAADTTLDITTKVITRLKAGETASPKPGGGGR